MIDKDKNLKIIEGCIVFDINYKYLKNFSYFRVKCNLESYFNSFYVLFKVFKIGLVIIF